MKKIFVILSLTILFFSTNSIYRINSADANAIAQGTRLAKVVGGSTGERVIAGWAEKAGINFTTKSARQKAVQRWNLDVHKKIVKYDELGKKWEAEELRKFQQSLADMKPSSVADVVPGGNGVSRAVVSAGAFLLGADILYDIYADYANSAEKQEVMEVMENYESGVEDGTHYTSLGGYYFLGYSPVHSSYKNGMDAVWWGPQLQNDYSVIFKQAAIDQMLTTKPMIWWMYLKKQPGITNGYTVMLHLFSYYYTSGNSYTTEKPLGTLMPQYDTRTKEVTVTEDEVTILPTVNPLLDPLREIGLQTLNPDKPVEIPNNYPKEVDIDIPSEDNYPDKVEKPWNDPWGEPVPEIDPGKTPGGGVDPGGLEDITPVGGVEPVPIPGGDKPPIIPEKPPKEPDDPEKPPGGEVPPGGKPGTFWMLLAFIDLLRAILWYIMRFVTFIVTIPAIPSIPIDNPAFHWIRTSKFLGIYPYALVLNLATLGLSLSVYKIVRRFI